MRIAAIHTSDRGSFKSCRRRWSWGSHLGMGLEPFQKASPLWFGTAIHFALEQYHGHNPYGTPKAAFMDFVRSSRIIAPDRLPPDHVYLTELGQGMCDYYLTWLSTRDPLQTYVVNGVPQIEVQFEIELPFEPDTLARWGYDKVVYRGTMDRVVYVPEYDAIRVCEYKTAARIEDLHLPTDPQVNAYLWAASVIYDKPVLGVVYQQHLKDLPKEPRILKSGAISTDQKQATTHTQYREMLKSLYGSVQGAPPSAIETLNYLLTKEGPDGDRFIFRSWSSRNQHQHEAEGVKILLEVAEMLEPTTAMYPHPTRFQCTWCPFEQPCLNLDDGSDWESLLADDKLYVKKSEESRSWQIVAQHPIQPVQEVRQMEPPPQHLLQPLYKQPRPQQHL